MLFNSHEFILIFLPLCILFSAFYRDRKKILVGLLLFFSLVFYSVWNINHLPLLLLSILLNYYIGLGLSKNIYSLLFKKKLLFFGISFNLIMLLIFKYAQFLLNINSVVLEVDMVDLNIVLPLAISFFTFQQIAYLVDCYQSKVKCNNVIDYSLFVAFFPQLIAGPIVHFKDIIPKLYGNIKKHKMEKYYVQGTIIFCFGLIKKVYIADNLAPHVDSVFLVSKEGAINFFEAWFAVCTFGMQIYFDFSGYCDMAVGLALMFGIRLPENFNSPYKSRSIITFWRRWHMTLSNFLKTYLYIPLGGNKNGQIKLVASLFMTMFLGGLWHGANYTFILWGGLHGFYLVVNHIWSKNRMSFNKKIPRNLYKIFSIVLTYLCVNVAWVLFRSDNLSSAVNIYKTMLGFNGIAYHPFLGELNDFSEYLWADPSWIKLYGDSVDVFVFSLTLLIVFFFPNRQFIVRCLTWDGIKKGVVIRYPIVSGILSGLCFTAILLSIKNNAEFIYFQF